MGTVGERRDASHQTMTDDKAAGGESGNVHGRGGWRAWRRPGGDSGWAEQRQAARGGGPCGGVVQIKALARDVPSATPAGARATVGVRGGGVAAGARRCFYQEWPTWWRCWQLSRGALSPAKPAIAGRFSSFPCCLTRAAKKTKGGGGNSRAAHCVRLRGRVTPKKWVLSLLKLILQAATTLKWRRMLHTVGG